MLKWIKKYFRKPHEVGAELACIEQISQKLQLAGLSQGDAKRVASYCVSDKLRPLETLAKALPTDILSEGFLWQCTAEGHKYWALVYRRLWECEHYADTSLSQEDRETLLLTQQLATKLFDAGLPFSVAETAAIYCMLEHPAVLTHLLDKAPSWFLDFGFTWTDTPEGDKYWNQMYHNLERQND